MAQKTIPLSAIRELQRELESAPEQASNEVNLTRAIELLAPAIRAMRAKGYSLDHIAGMLGKKGISITAHSLKNYLQRLRPGPGKTRKRGATLERPKGVAGRVPAERRKEAGLRAVAGNSPTTPTEATKTPSRPSGDPPAALSPTPPRPPADPTATQSASTPRSRYVGFVPRPDTKDI